MTDDSSATTSTRGAGLRDGTTLVIRSNCNSAPCVQRRAHEAVKSSSAAVMRHAGHAEVMPLSRSDRRFAKQFTDCNPQRVRQDGAARDVTGIADSAAKASLAI